MSIEEIKEKIAEMTIAANKIRPLYESAEAVIGRIKLLERDDVKNIEELDFLYLKLEEVVKEASQHDISRNEILLFGPEIKRTKFMEV